MTRVLRGLCVALLWFPSLCLAEEPAKTELSVVEALMRAFNEHDPEAMGAHFADDVGMFYVQRETVSVEAMGRQALVGGMKAYFESVPTVRSEIEASMVSGAYVIIRERVFWESDAETLSQSSLAIYQVADGLIQNVWYYPAEK